MTRQNRQAETDKLFCDSGFQIVSYIDNNDEIDKFIDSGRARLP